MGTQIEVLLCPECGCEVQETVRHSGFQSGGSSIGPSEIACQNCRTYVATGLSEWSEKHIVQKITFFVGRFLWFVAASFFLPGLFAFAVSSLAVYQAGMHSKHKTLCFAVAFSVGTFFLGLTFLRQIAKELRASRERVAAADPKAQSESILFGPK